MPSRGEWSLSNYASNTSRVPKGDLSLATLGWGTNTILRRVCGQSLCTWTPNPAAASNRYHERLSYVALLYLPSPRTVNPPDPSRKNELFHSRMWTVLSCLSSLSTTCTVLNPIHDLVNEIFHDHDKLIRFKIRTGIKRIRMAPWVWGPLCIKPGRSRHKICPLLLLLPPAQPILGFFHLQVVPSRTIIRSVSDIPYIQISGLTCCPTVQPSESTDITFKSSDNIKFCLHRRNLETHAEAFPGPDISVEQEEVINLTESSNVLAIVFNFMYPRKQADIEKMTFETVAQVAEAVEKYQVFSAMKVCEMRLK